MRRSSIAWWKCAGFLLWALAVVLLALRFHLRLADFTIDNVRAFILSFGWWSPAVFLVAFAQPIVPLPVSVIAMAAGLSFGFVPGLALTVIAGTVRGCGQFLIARALGREAVARMLKGRWASLDKQLGSHGFWAVFWFRILPSAVPYDAQNLLLGVSSVPFGMYSVATFCGLIPALLIWVYLGKTVTSWSQFGIIALVLTGIILVRFFYKALRRRRTVSG